MDGSNLNQVSQRPNLSFGKLENAYKAGKYKNIQIILSKNGNCQIGQKYLMVSKSGFSIVRILVVDFKNDKIFIDLEDSNTSIVKQLSFDIDDNEFRYLFIAWNDIRQMVYEESVCNFTNDDLLELETD